MFKRFAAALAAGTFLVTAASSAATPPSPSPHPQKAEIAFVSSIQKDLGARFPTAADAIKAGYFRYTTEDKTGSISYANLAWTSADPGHPSQLWYDANGKLLGADYSVPRTGKTQPAPSLWGVDPNRWERFGAHIHWVLAGPINKKTFGDTSLAKFVAAGGDPKAPSAQTLLKMGVVSDAAAVEHIFLFPSIWDLQVWVKPNPNGAFAEMNPLVTPSASADKSGM